MKLFWNSKANDYKIYKLSKNPKSQQKAEL